MLWLLMYRDFVFTVAPFLMLSVPVPERPTERKLLMVQVVPFPWTLTVPAELVL